jgi:hypothetical protein
VWSMTVTTGDLVTDDQAEKWAAWLNEVGPARLDVIRSVLTEAGASVGWSRRRWWRWGLGSAVVSPDDQVGYLRDQHSRPVLSGAGPVAAGRCADAVGTWRRAVFATG